MCEPVTLTATAIALSAAAAGATAYGVHKQAKAEKAAKNYAAGVSRNNAIIAENLAKDALDRGDIAEKQHRLRVSELKGKQKSVFAASGVDLSYGTPVDVFSDTEALGEFDALTIRNNAERESQRFKLQAYNDTVQGDLTQSQADDINPLLRGTTSLISGASQTATTASSLGVGA